MQLVLSSVFLSPLYDVDFTTTVHFIRTMADHKDDTHMFFG